LVLAVLIIRLEARLQPNIGLTLRRVLTVSAFGYNSAESEPIWMKSGALRVHCRRLALADFGRDPPSSNSWRAMQNFVFLSGKQHTISPISRQPNFAKFEHNTSIGVAI